MVDEFIDNRLTVDHDLDLEQSKYEHSLSEKHSIKGFTFPFDRSDSRGFFHTAFDYELIKADLIQLILTEPGERVMMPLYGVGIRKMFFETNDNISMREIENLIARAIDNWEPRIVVIKLEVSPIEINTKISIGDSRFQKKQDDISENGLIVSIEYSLKKDLGNINKLEFRANLNPINQENI